MKAANGRTWLNHKLGETKGAWCGLGFFGWLGLRGVVLLTFVAAEYWRNLFAKQEHSKLPQTYN